MPLPDSDHSHGGEYKFFLQTSRDCLLREMLGSTRNGDSRSTWKVRLMYYIMDRATVKVMSHSCKMSDTSDQGISLSPRLTFPIEFSPMNLECFPIDSQASSLKCMDEAPVYRGFLNLFAFKKYVKEVFSEHAANSRRFDACLNVMAARIAIVFASLKSQNRGFSRKIYESPSSNVEVIWQLFVHSGIKSLLDLLAKENCQTNEYSCMNVPSSTAEVTSKKASARSRNAPVAPEKKTPHSMRSRRTANWARPNHYDDGHSSDLVSKNATLDLKKVGRRIFVFIIGGATRSWLRASHKLTTKLGSEVVLGCTSLDDPPQYTTKLKTLSEAVTEVPHDHYVWKIEQGWFCFSIITTNWQQV
ncbi:hypothetical protein MANES_01G266004v8 [Manihot esculenta]|uniref:Uncharacterized protein n=1 Tax=Manihot esculenta TaxID=3983 RepID=A0ACB7IGP9_MANES|nr:hypothetical protein MANES_01G266004v8 [Manihot esculenta]